MTKKRPHLRARTTGTLNALAAFGAGGATAAEIAKKTRMRPQQASARLRWLKRGALVRYCERGERWYLADDTLFKESR